MTYDARQVANWFVTRAQREGRKLSIMSLLKLTYIAHGWHLETQNAPLFGNRIEAWQYGPVIPDVYNDFRRQGVAVSGTVNTVPQSRFDPADEALLDQVWNIYGKLPAFRLSDLTHVPGGPWDIAPKTGGYYAPIPDELIHQHYMVLRARSKRQGANV
jgi:uncharacterized phage-associated protein